MTDEEIEKAGIGKNYAQMKEEQALKEFAENKAYEKKMDDRDRKERE